MLQSLRATTTEVSLLEPVLCNKRSHHNEKPGHCNEQQPLLTSTGESLHAPKNTSHSQKINLKKKKKIYIYIYNINLLLHIHPHRILILEKQWKASFKKLNPPLDMNDTPICELLLLYTLYLGVCGIIENNSYCIFVF